MIKTARSQVDLVLIYYEHFLALCRVDVLFYWACITLNCNGWKTSFRYIHAVSAEKIMWVYSRFWW